MTNFSPSLALLCVRASSRAYLTATDSEPTTDTHYLILELPDSGCVRKTSRSASISHKSLRSSKPFNTTLAELETKNPKPETPSGLVIVAFRGTSSLEDFLCDADFFTTHINLNNDARVHLGFYKAYKSIESRLKARLDEIVTRRAAGSSIRNLQSEIRNIPIIFTGHSLGGALAILAAYYLNRFYNTEAVYTFGAPDVGNADFARNYNSPRTAPVLGRCNSDTHSDLEVTGRSRTAPRVLECGSPLPLSIGSPPSFSSLPSVGIPLGEKTFCLANAGDPVTWLPPYRFGFRRVGKFFFLPGVNWLQPGFRLPRAARLAACIYQVFQNCRRGRLALLTNHSLSLYKQRVAQLTHVKISKFQPPTSRETSIPQRRDSEAAVQAPIWMLVIGASLVLGAWTLGALISET